MAAGMAMAVRARRHPLCAMGGSMDAHNSRFSHQYLAQMPTPQSGNVGQVDYSAQIKQAMDAGDSDTILAILSQSAANNQQA